MQRQRIPRVRSIVILILFAAPALVAQESGTDNRPRPVASPPPIDSRVPPVDDAPPTLEPVNGANAEEFSFRPGQVLEGSILATLGQDTNKDPYSEQLCRTSQALLQAADLLSQLSNNNNAQRKVLIHQMRKEAAACLREAGY